MFYAYQRNYRNQVAFGRAKTTYMTGTPKCLRLALKRPELRKLMEM